MLAMKSYGKGDITVKNKKLDVLIIDDEEEFASALLERLKLRSIEAYAANSGGQALALLEEQRPDIVVLDVIMPGMGGLEILKRIKMLDSPPQVILLTGRGSTKEGMEGMRLGAFDYLVKPVDIEELIGKMKAAVKTIQ